MAGSRVGYVPETGMYMTDTFDKGRKTSLHMRLSFFLSLFFLFLEKEKNT